MKLTIIKVDNGYYLEMGNDGEFDVPPSFRVIEEGDTDYDAKTTQKLLYAVMECFGLVGSKHDAERCVVRVINPNGKEVE